MVFVTIVLLLHSNHRRKELSSPIHLPPTSHLRPPFLFSYSSTPTTLFPFLFIFLIPKVSFSLYLWARSLVTIWFSLCFYPSSYAIGVEVALATDLTHSSLPIYLGFPSSNTFYTHFPPVPREVVYPLAMASVNRNQVNNNHANCSPNSSEEIESHHGTPATKFSAFSPEDLLEGLKLVSHGIKRDKVPPAFVLTQAQSNFAPRGKGHDSSTAAIHDPFVSAPFLTSTTRSSTDVSKLSPVASVFTPSSVIGSFSSYGTAGSPEQPLSAPTCSNGPSSFGRLGGPSVANAYHEGQACSTSVNGDIELYPVWPSTSSSFINLGRLKLGQFSSDDGTSRSLMISKVPRTVSEIEINAFFSVSFNVSKRVRSC